MRDEIPTVPGCLAGPRSIARDVPVRARVLVVDDEPGILRVVQRVLDDHDVVTAPDAFRAIAILDASPQFDIVLCDVVMPGISGIEFWAEMLLTRPGIAERIVFMTGGAPSPGDEQFLDSGAVEVLRKPFSFDLLRRVVELHAGIGA